MNLKRIALFALLVVAFAGSAHAQTFYPLSLGHVYTCHYTNPTFHETQDGLSVFKIGADSVLMRGIEGFESDTVGFDNRKVTFAKPQDIILHLPNGDDKVQGTRWEFTINPSGPQCNAVVKMVQGTPQINFTQCTDGSARFCTALY